jgi:hypothetical protein
VNDPIANPSGGAPPGGGEEEQQVQAVVQMLGQMLQAFFPTLPPEVLLKVARVSFMESTNLAQVIEDAMPVNPASKENPFWGFQAMLATDPKNVVTVASPKIIDPSNLSLADVLRQLAILGLLSTPMVRGMARLYGVKFAFFQNKVMPGEKPLIILPR